VDIRAQLRRYLEQRRDAGDQELVLDSLSVDEVMRLLGAFNSRPIEKEVPVVPKAELLPVAVPGDSIVVGKSGAGLFAGPHAALATLDDVAAAATVCTRCSLSQSATRCVPGEGSPQAQLVCVGEAPGETEDQTGRPFVGKAGQLLTKILAAIDIKREDAFIVNVLKHRPPGNRNPLPNEVAACSPFLVRQIELINPKVILALGTFAAQTLLETKLSIGKLRGTIHRYYGVPLIVTYHPAALLRNPHWKRPAWDDVQQARRLLDASTATDGA
jgi:uracil-DNA glycosylase family 4